MDKRRRMDRFGKAWGTAAWLACLFIMALVGAVDAAQGSELTMPKDYRQPVFVG